MVLLTRCLIIHGDGYHSVATDDGKVFVTSCNRPRPENVVCGMWYGTCTVSDV